MNSKVLFASLTAGMIAMFLSCSGEYPGFKKTESGIYYKIHVDNEQGELAETGDILSMQMIYRTEDSVLFDTQTSNQPMTLPLMEKQYEGDIYEALATLKVGDSATFILDAENFFLKTAGMPQLPEFITSGSKLYFDVKLITARSEAEIETEKNLLMDERLGLEPQELADYLATNEITVAPTESGLYIIEKEKGSGASFKIGDRIKAHFIISTVNGSQLYSTYDQGQPMEVEIGKDFDNDGITEAIETMKKGTKATVIVPSNLAFGREGRGEMVPPYTTMVYEVEITEHTTQEQYQKQQQQKELEMKQQEEASRTGEKANIQKYMQDNNLSGTPTASGLYYIEQVKGTGAKAEAGKKVTVHYTGRLLDGSKFDSSVDRGEPFEFQLGMGQVIKGWDEGVAMMNVGSKALLIIPFEIAYGSRAMGAGIPAYSTLVFEVELLGVE
ncbi:MAG: FKBP-type peptidyl-prolyl cis-trans isomerase [Bacteroidales bacterium]|nr:FKBP-type peptidyl-prolyl cis-trans isomerase [Bacteroidales bacterium]